MTFATLQEPTPANIRAARIKSKLGQEGASVLIHVSRQSWRLYEDGKTKMKLGLWELFLFKTGQYWPQQATASKPKASGRGRVQNLRPFTRHSSTGTE